VVSAAGRTPAFTQRQRYTAGVRLRAHPSLPGCGL